jgi:hypothetical protein
MILVEIKEGNADLITLILVTMIPIVNITLTIIVMWHYFRLPPLVDFLKGIGKIVVIPKRRE